MVSFVGMKCEENSQADTEKNSIAPEMDTTNNELANEDTEMHLDDEEDTSNSDLTTGATKLKRQSQQQHRHAPTPAPGNGTEVSPTPAAGTHLDPDEEEPDEEQLKRILACKRLSEGNCNRHLVGLNNICRKNSLHFIGESLPPVTEGEPMRHMSHHMSQNMESSQSSSTSSSSLRGGGGNINTGLGGIGVVRHLASKRNSQDDNTTSCSSSTSLDCSGSGGPRSPSRRRSSTVSQCSSVLSEGTRQQLNFDLSPDLPPDSSILEANAISPTEFDRPASPEPSSLGSADGSFDMRPISRMSQFCDDLLTDAAVSPDSTLGDSTDNTTAGAEGNAVAQLMIAMRQQQQQQRHRDETVTLRQTTKTPPAGLFEFQADGEQSSEMMTSEKLANGHHNHQQQHQQEQHQQRALDQLSNEANITDNLERIISHVSEVKVSSNTPDDQLDCRLPASEPEAPARGQQQAAVEGQNQNAGSGVDGNALAAVTAGQKRAHTPFGANIQRNKATHTEFTG